jgi:hypothetical protein
METLGFCSVRSFLVILFALCTVVSARTLALLLWLPTGQRAWRYGVGICVIHVSVCNHVPCVLNKLALIKGTKIEM